MHTDAMRHAITLRMDEQAWSKILHESRRTGIQPGPLARSYVLAALESVELPSQDQLPNVSPKPSATKSNTTKQTDVAPLSDELLPPSAPKARRNGPTRSERRGKK